MKNLKVMMAYFSGTNNTKKIADIITKKLEDINVSITVIDITAKSIREEDISISDYDAFIFGFPIYSLRAPRVCRNWLKKLNGQGKKCSVFFTYGGFGKDPAHYYIKELLDKQNFKLVSTAEFLGAHTFNYSGWQAATDRPNKSDFKLAEEYTVATVKRFTGEDPGELRKFKKPKYSKIQLNMAEKYRFNLIKQLPTRVTESCCMCGICESICPTNAMNAKKGTANPKACIACFKCIANCPEKVIKTNDLSHAWSQKLKFHKTTKEEIDNSKGIIYL